MKPMITDFNGRSGSIPTASIQWDSSWPGLAGEDDRQRILSYLEDRFGISRTCFADYLLLRKKKSWFLIRRTVFLAYASRLKVSQVGLRAFQMVAGFVKPTTRFIQSFGRFATKGKLHVTLEQLHALVKGEKIEVDIRLENGYVILTLDHDRVPGLGLYINGVISSQLPKKEIRGTMLDGNMKHVGIEY